jgi:hypothetical protein
MQEESRVRQAERLTDKLFWTAQHLRVVAQHGDREDLADDLSGICVWIADYQDLLAQKRTTQGLPAGRRLSKYITLF